MNKYTNEQGRSMIEMLGVLAIVGVLSVAGIQGYSKAMEKYKINQLKDQMQTISTNMITTFNVMRGYKELGNDKETATENVKELGIFPENMVQADGSIRHALGGNVYVYAVEYGGVPDSAFTIDFEGLPQKIAVQLSSDGSMESNRNVMNIGLNINN